MAKGGFNSNKVKIWTRMMGTVYGLLKTVCTLVIIVCFVIIALPGKEVRLYFGDSGSRYSTASAAKREALPPGSVNETDYFAKDTFLDDPIVIEEGLKHFYELTGVQPYVQIETSVDNLYISQDLDISRDLVAYTRALYPQLFTDESHLLLVFYYNYDRDYTIYKLDFCIVIGSKAKTVIDGGAEKILSDNIESSFHDSGISEKMFSNAFSDAGDRIMGVIPPKSDITVFIIPGVLALLVLLVLLRNMKKKRKLKAQQDKEILNRPLEQYGADTGAKAETPAQDNSSFSDGSAGSGHGMGNAAPDGAGYDTLPKDEAEILAEKYAVRSNKASADNGPNTKTGRRKIRSRQSRFRK